MKNVVIVIGALFSLMANFSIAQTVAVEQLAEFPGGLAKFYKYLNKNVKISEAARKKGVSGKIYIEFFVKESGEVDKDSIRVVPKDEMIKLIGEARASDIIVDRSLESEAMRVMRNCPTWIPGSIRDVPVRQKMLLPFSIKK